MVFSYDTSPGWVTARRAMLASGLLVIISHGAAPAEDSALELSYREIRLNITSAPSPKVTENVSGSTGSATYDWERKHTQGLQGGVGLFYGKLDPTWGGLVYGAQVSGAQYDITPSTYHSNGIEFPTGGNSLSDSTIGIDVFAGYGWSSGNEPGELEGRVEIGPFVGGGAANAKTENRDPSSGNFQTASAWGAYYELGARAGAYLVEDRFMIGVLLHYTYGVGKVDVTMPDGEKSKLTLKRNGVGFGIETGYRF